MTIDNGIAIVLAYVLASIGLIIAAFVIGWFIGRLRHRREQRGDE